MGIIQKLPQLVANQIAAGETIEHPAAIIRELLDNSVDAGAKNILIQVTYQSSDKDSLRLMIQDDGVGMDEADLRLATQRYATSKIRSLEDIYTVSSLGFRGEGLNAIASVCHLKITSKTQDAHEATAITVEEGKISRMTGHASKQGTCIDVSHIFANVPVRKKFLKRGSAERMHIKHQVMRQLLGIEGINLRYVTVRNHQSTTDFHIRSEDTLKDKCALFYGASLTKELLPIDVTRDGISVKGYVSSGHYRGHNRRNQIFIVGRRPVKNATLEAAFNAAYMNLLASREYAACFLHITFPEKFVDMNIHPTKADVAFVDAQLVYKVLYHSVQETVRGRMVVEGQRALSPSQTKASLDDVAMISPLGSASRFHEKTSPTEKPFAMQDTSLERPPKRPLFFLQADLAAKKPSGEDMASTPPLPLASKADKQDGGIPADPPKVEVIGQLALSYILYSNGTDLFIVDQHAADERLHFERLKQRYEGEHPPERQGLLTPLIIQKGDIAISELLRSKDLFAKFGISLEPFSKTSLQVEYIPSFFPEGKEEDFTLQLMDVFLENKHLKITEIFEKFFSTVACHMSVTAGEALSRSYMKELIEALYTENMLHACPHGRPFVKKIPLQEVERYFHRR